jgi:hypothetical protein
MRTTDFSNIELTAAATNGRLLLAFTTADRHRTVAVARLAMPVNKMPVNKITQPTTVNS